MSRKKPQEIGVTNAADFLYSIINEFKPADDLAREALKEAEILLNLAVERLLLAFENNVRAKLAKGKSPR